MDFVEWMEEYPEEWADEEGNQIISDEEMEQKYNEHYASYGDYLYDSWRY